MLSSTVLSHGRSSRNEDEEQLQPLATFVVVHIRASEAYCTTDACAAINISLNVQLAADITLTRLPRGAWRSHSAADSEVCEAAPLRQMPYTGLVMTSGTAAAMQICLL